ARTARQDLRYKPAATFASRAALRFPSQALTTAPFIRICQVLAKRPGFLIPASAASSLRNSRMLARCCAAARREGWPGGYSSRTFMNGQPSNPSDRNQSEKRSNAASSLLPGERARRQTSDFSHSTVHSLSRCSRKAATSSCFERNVLVGYGVAVLTVAAAFAALLLMQTHWQASAPVSLLLAAVIVTTWLAGTKPGLLAMALALLGFNYSYIGLTGLSGNAPIQAIGLLSFTTLACYVVWITATERGAAESLRRAHDGLQRTNEAL